MLEIAREGDEDAIMAFLDKRARTSMFLRSNLLQFGLTNTQAPHGGTYLLLKRDGEITGVFGRSNKGYLVCQCPSSERKAFAAFADWLAGQKVLGITGEVEQVKTAVAAFGWSENDMSLYATEPMYHAKVTDFPSFDDHIRKPCDTDAPILQDWFTQYVLETGLVPDPIAAAEHARDRVTAQLTNPTIRLLIRDGAPVAMAGTNARALETAQIGGVFTPKHLRGQGLAGRAIALYMQELVANGVTDVLLFAASAEAAKAYEKIGFKRIGEYQLAMLKAPHIQGAT